MPRKTMGNKPISPSLAAFGFTSKKRHINGGEEASPSKRVKTSPKKSGGDNTGSAIADRKSVVDVSRDNNVVDLSQDSSSPEPLKERRGQRTRMINLANDDDVEMLGSSKPVAIAAAFASGSQQSNSSIKLDGSQQTVSSPKKAVTKTTDSTTFSPHRNAPTSLGLIRVKDPNNILCTAVVAKARTNSSGIKRIFPGATLGRTSNSSHKDECFVDLGISANAKGISRRHVAVLRMNGEGGDDNESVVTAHSSNSAKSTASASVSSPTVLIKVLQHPNPKRETLKVQIHRTRRNKRRKLDLKQNECKTMRVGDVLEFVSDADTWYFCLVAFCDEDGEKELRGVKRETGARDVVHLDEAIKEVTSVHDSQATQDMPQKDGEMDAKPVHKKVEQVAAPTDVVAETKLKSDATSDESKTSVEARSPTKMPTVSLSTSHGVVAPKLRVNPARSLKTGDNVRVVYQLADAFGIEHEEWHYGTVGLVRTNAEGIQSINVALNTGEDDNFDIPHPEVEAVDDAVKESSEPLKVGDFVECNFQNFQWYHGRVADISADGSMCEVLYHDGDYEVDIPTNQDKIRVSRPCDQDYGWLVNRPTLIGRKGTINAKSCFRGECQLLFDDGSKTVIECEDIVSGYGAHLLSSCKPPKRKNASYHWLHDGSVVIGRRGVIKEVPRDESTSNCSVMFEGGSEESIPLADAMKGAFACLLQGIGLDHQFVMPATEKLDETRAMKQEATAPTPTNDSARGGRKISTKRVSIKLDGDDNDFEPVDGHCLVFKTGLNAEALPVSEEERVSENYCDDLDSDFRFIGTKKVARTLPPGIPNMLWHALNCPEAKTGFNMLQDLLYVHDRVPDQDLTSKLWQLMIKGPKADGHNVFFKDPFRTELASQYVYSLIRHSNRLIRSDGSAIFGPREWSDIESLLSQSIDQCENLTGGKRLAECLHLAARGSKLLLLMLQTELRDVDLTSPMSNSFEQMPLKSMPTVKEFIDNWDKKSQTRADGVRKSLKAVVRHVTKCLVHHSRFILDVDDFHPERRSYKGNFYDDSCANEAVECFDNLGRVVSYAAFLFCVAENIKMDNSTLLYLIRDEFNSQLIVCFDNLPELNKTSEKKFTSILKEVFIGAIGGDFALPLYVGLAKLMGCEQDLADLGEVTFFD